MPRRRLIDPSFWDDLEVSQLSRDERLFLLGCLGNADDEGRLPGHNVFLKSKIFMYDDDVVLSPMPNVDDIGLLTMQHIKESTLEKMQSWSESNIWLLESYKSGDLEFLHFPHWQEFNKPSHPTPSKIPAPPHHINSGGVPEPIRNNTGGTQEALPNDSALGQVRSSQVKLGKDRSAPVDFKGVMGSEKDLTDLLTTTLKEYMPRGPAAASLLSEFWSQTVGSKMSDSLFNYTYDAVKKYPADVIAKAFVKTAKYGGGKTGSYKYLKTVLEEKAGE